MKNFINKVLARVLNVVHRRQLPFRVGVFFVSPMPAYISQFVGIYPQAITIETDLDNEEHIKIFGACDSKEFTFWAWRDCGIACVKMILDASVSNSKKMMELTREGIDLGGYILYEDGVFVDKGWFHHSLVQLLKKYEVDAVIKRWQSLESVARDILSNRLVILSATVPGRNYIMPDGSFRANEPAKYGGHLFLAIGVKMNGSEVEGIYVHDPRGLEKYQANTWIPADVYRRIMSGRTMVAKNRQHTGA